MLGEAGAVEKLAEVIGRLRHTYGVDVFIEPGAAFIRSAGYIVSSVLDVINGTNKAIAVLDTTVNHWPEIYEYQFEPDVVDHVERGRYEYVLAGCSCLPGDILGEYSFDSPLTVGSRVVIANAGAYSLAKAHFFNGINLPTIFALTGDGKLVMKRRYTYQDFLSRCAGVELNAVV